ncbi:MAG: ATP synthase F1 subunit epsilon [Candidatus Doudnabacteria bacterium]|nr:ATP synthase F1 subunit epsilon [Candidatus Doudnabacteria bacterium]
MKFKIVTPERIALETEVDALTLPTTMGEITILPNHIPLVAQLIAGEVKYKSSNRENFFAVSGGVIEVKGNNEVLILADTAEFGHEIDVARAEQAREAARKLMTESYHDQKTYADASAAFQKHLIRLKVARKHHSHKGTKLEN